MPREPRKPLKTDLTDEEWGVIQPLIPSAKELGRKRSTDLREVLNAICFRWRQGCTWREIPKGFPPWATVYTYYRAWRHNGVLAKMETALEAVQQASSGTETPSQPSGSPGDMPADPSPSTGRSAAEPTVLPISSSSTDRPADKAESPPPSSEAA